MKRTKILTALVISLITAALAFTLSSCMKEEDYHTKTDVDALVAGLEAAMNNKAAANEAAITALKAEYEAKIAELEATDEDAKAELEELTATYNSKVAELEAEDKENGKHEKICYLLDYTLNNGSTEFTANITYIN